MCLKKDIRNFLEYIIFFNFSVYVVSLINFSPCVSKFFSKNYLLDHHPLTFIYPNTYLSSFLLYNALLLPPFRSLCLSSFHFPPRGLAGFSAGFFFGFLRLASTPPRPPPLSLSSSCFRIIIPLPLFFPHHHPSFVYFSNEIILHRFT